MEVIICELDVGLLLLQQPLKEHVFGARLVQLFLGVGLVDHQLSPTSFAFLAGEVGILFRFFDFVHGGGVGKVLDLAWRDAFLLFHPLDRIIHVDVLLDSQLLQVLLKLIDSSVQLSRRHK